MNSRPEDSLLALYDEALARHGDTAPGALWPNEADRIRRYDVMLDLLEAAPAGVRVLLCDLACGTGGLLARIRERGLSHVDYRGLDRSSEAIGLARAKFPDADFRCFDLLAADADLGALDCDFLVANGLFTVRGTMSEQQMCDFLDRVLALAWPRVRRGLAFNVMSKVVDWERDDLFHAPMDDMARRLHALAGRRVRLRADYGLYEYTCQAFRDPGPAVPENAVVATDVPVLRPQLAPAEKLLPYLRRIDAARVYSNFGPLVLEFETRLGTMLNLPRDGLVTANTGTAGLVAAILASAGRAGAARPFALMPAYTFVATAVAAQECGFQPWLADVRAEDWQLDPEQALAHPEINRMGVVMPVAPYGRPVDPAPWRAFSERTGIPVVIDGAASLEQVSLDPARWLGEVLVVFSLHATKGLATGEGGAVACTDLALAARIGQALNYGFYGSRESRTPSINGKMSEYHAAVGLAELDGWPDKYAALLNVAARYRAAAAEHGLAHRLHTAPAICSSYVLFEAADAESSLRLQQALAREHIGFRLWYGSGLAGHSHFADAPSAPLPVTRDLAPRLLGLPVAPDLDAATITRVMATLAGASR